jgi:putative flippase GtrA
VGVAAFLVNASLVELLAHSLGLGGAQIIAFPTAATTAWWLNRRYTFGASDMSMSREWIRYMYANSIGWFLNNATYCVVVAHLQLAQSNPCLAVAAGSIAGLTANFALSHHLVFKKK